MADKKYQYVQALAEQVASNPALAEEIKRDPSAALRQLAAPSPVPDTWIYRIVVGSLGLTVLLTVITAAVLAWQGNEKVKLPDGVIAIGAAAAGALAGLLAPSPVRS